MFTFRLIVVASLSIVVFADVSHIVPTGGARNAPNGQTQHQDARSFSYETETGINAAENIAIDNSGEITVQGQYSYVSPEGQSVVLAYTADGEGFHPQGSHLPVPPPIPEAIQRSLIYNLNHPQPQ